MKLNNNDDSHNSGLNLLIYNMLLDIESHPTWVCGLKPHKPRLFQKIQEVTPYVGVWIETLTGKTKLQKKSRSHPTWVCGLKQSGPMRSAGVYVTPYVGVWIETEQKSTSRY